MKILKIAGALLCIGLGIVKTVGLFFVLADSGSGRASGWITKQSIYAISFIMIGVYLWWIRNAASGDGQQP